ncbi:MAG: hypothetical protein H6643_02130 [Caldilineaceae bacterium]|nr:hypothetical protein [Caldilineaceae bacterium]
MEFQAGTAADDPPSLTVLRFRGRCKRMPLAYDLQAYMFNTILFNANCDCLTQVFHGRVDADEAIQKMQIYYRRRIAGA